MAAVKPVYFGAFLVTSQVFYRTTHCFALVNLKPLLPGHVLVCPNRVVPRLKDLSAEEVTDLFLTVQKISKVVEKIYKADALNIAMQDGIAAGQSVPHVHTHIIPRKFKDFEDVDQIYAILDDEDLTQNYIGAGYPIRTVDTDGAVSMGRPRFPTVRKDEDRKLRTEQVMKEEAEWLAQKLREAELD